MNFSKRSLSLDETLSRCISHFEKVGAHKFLYSPQEEDKYFKELFIVVMFCYGLRRITKREWFIKEFKGDPPDFELIAFSDRKLKDRPIDHVIGELVEIPSILEIIDNDDKINKIKEIIQKKDKKQYKLGTVLLVFINVPIVNSFYNNVIETISGSGKSFKNIWLLRIPSIAENGSYNCKIEEIKPKSTNEILINLGKEWGEGIIFNHKYIDKFKEKR